MKSLLKPLLRVVPLTVASLMLSASLVQAKPYLTIGQPAPELKPAKWLKGDTIPQFAKGHVYVVEFWATWCGPCKAAIPHLTELAKKYAGKADLIGVDVMESIDPSIPTLPKVEKFVKDQGARMDYHVAADAPDNHIANAWLKAAGEGGLPTAFVIGRDGKIAWIGNPILGLDAALKQVVEDKFDVAAAGAERAHAVGPAQAIQTAIGDKNYTGALKLIDAEVTKNPASQRLYDYTRFVCLAHTDLPEFQKQSRAVLTQVNGEIGVYQMFCSIFASEKDLTPDAYKFGRSLVNEALEKKDREYLFLAMGAGIDSSLGDKDGAIRTGTAAVKAAETDPHCTPEMLQFIRKNLEKFKGTGA